MGPLYVTRVWRAGTNHVDYTCSNKHSYGVHTLLGPHIRAIVMLTGTLGENNNAHNTTMAVFEQKPAPIPRNMAKN